MMNPRLGAFLRWSGCLAPAAMVTVLWCTRSLTLLPPWVNGAFVRPKDALEAWQRYGGWALLLAALVLLVLGLSRRWWRPAVGDRESPAEDRTWPTSDKWLLAAVLAVSVALRLPLLDMTMHRDEQDNLVHHVLGAWRTRSSDHAAPQGGEVRTVPRDELVVRLLDRAEQQGDDRRWSAVPWSSTLFLNREGNNSVPCGTTARLANRLWQIASTGNERRFCLPLLRTPGFLAATVALGFFFAVTRSWFGRTGAVVAALAWCGHPLFLAYGVYCRGYAWMWLGLMVAWWCYDRARRSDARWRTWFAGGLGLLFAVFSFTGTAFPASFLLLATLWRLWRSQWLGLRDWIVGHALAFALWLPLGLPHLAQTAFYMRHEYLYETESRVWMMKFLGASLCGLVLPTKSIVPVGTAADAIPHDWWARCLATAPDALVTILVVAPMVIVVAWIALGRHHPARPVLAATLAGLTTAALWYAFGSQQELLYWYGAYAAPVVPVSLGALAVARIPGTLQAARPAWIRHLPLAMTVLLTGYFLWLCFPNGRPGRLDHYPPEKFTVLWWRYNGYRIGSDCLGRSVIIPGR